MFAVDRRERAAFTAARFPSSERVSRSLGLRAGAWLHRLRERPGRFGDLGPAAAAAQAAQWDRALLERRAADRLAHVLEAAERRDFYNRAGRRGSGADLAAFPVLEKPGLQAAANALMIEAPGDVEVTTTSGTSGQVTQLVRPRASDIERAALDRRLYDALELPAFFDFVIVVPWLDPGAARWGLHDWRVRCRQVALADVARSAERGQAVGDLLISVPRLCRRLASLGLGASHALVAGFELADRTRAHILGRPGVDDAAPAEIYSASELCSAIAFRFPDCSRLHVNADGVYVEVLAVDTAEPVPDGMPGDLVITDLLNDAMPLIRYRIGDIGAVDARRCACGRATSTLRLLGRSVVVGADVAALLAASDLGAAADELVVQTARDELVLCGAAADRRRNAARLADANGVRLLTGASAIPEPLASLGTQLRAVSIAERIPSDRAEGSTLRELHDQLGIHDPRLELEVER